MSCSKCEDKDAYKPLNQEYDNFICFKNHIYDVKRMALNLRDEKAIKIFSKINEIEKITNNRFSVKSQTTERWYVVEKLRAADVWTCECRDFMNRLVSGLDVRCKHIMACQMLQDSVREASGIESVNLPKICPKCNSIVKSELSLPSSTIARCPETIQITVVRFGRCKVKVTREPHDSMLIVIRRE